MWRYANRGIVNKESMMPVIEMANILSIHI